MTDMETLRRYLSDAEVKMSGFVIRQENKIKKRHKIMRGMDIYI